MIEILPLLGSLLVGGGVSGVVISLIGAATGRRPRQAEYTTALVKIANEITESADRRARDITESADKRAQALEEKVERLETQMDALDERIADLQDLLRVAIPLLQAAGHDQIAADMRAALVRRAV